MDKQELLQLARTNDRERLEKAWMTWLESIQFGTETGVGQSASDVAQILETLGQRPLAATLLKLFYDEARNHKAHAELLPVLQRLGRLSPNTPGLRGDLLESLRAIHSQNLALEGALKASGLVDGSHIPKELDLFEHYKDFTPGRHVLHSSGWGAGQIREIDASTAQVVIDFEGKKNHRMTFEGVNDLLEFLEDDDLRSLRVSRPEELDRLAKEEPSKLLMMTVKSLENTAPLSLIRSQLKGSIIPEKSWSRWWTKAKKEAMADPYLEVARDGRVTLREEAISPLEETIEQIDRAANFSKLWKIASTFLRTTPEEEARKAIANHIAPATLKEEDLDTFPQIAEALVFLESETIPGTSERLDTLASDSDKAVQIFSELGTKERQMAFLDRIVTQSETAQDWGETFLGILVMGKSRVNKEIRERLIDSEQTERLGRLEQAILQKPEDFSEPFLEIIKKRWKPSATTWEVSELIRPALRFAADLERNDDYTKAAKARFLKHVENFLLEDELTVIRSYISNCNEEELVRTSSYLERSPSISKVHSAVRKQLEELLPDLKPAPVANRFWENEFIYVTSTGLSSRQERLRILLDEEIPENRDAIGRAAAFGDLSENSEYTAALEKQRELTGLASQISKEIEKARLIESEIIQKDIVSPGTRVEVSDLATGKIEAWEILGPWDADVEKGAISYRTPVAAAILGKHVGDKAEVVLPESTTEYRIMNIEMIFDDVKEEETSSVSSAEPSEN
ncbi:MAG: GreA/GreB family elongation factor [Planctomycetota bacterium]|nr:GreA/GreB family elongation factor [Planctomycetota bacterium]